MASIGVLGWVVGRLRGRKGSLSMSCMGHSHRGEADVAADQEQQSLRDEVTRLREEVAKLRAQLHARLHEGRAGSSRSQTQARG
jgi:hypothetical protein